MTDLTQAPESLFWYWISERHAIYLRRQAGQPKPWTSDEILQTYKFTNPFRENDRGTVWLRENFLEPHRSVKHHQGCDYLTHPKLVTGSKVTGADCTCGADSKNLSLLTFNICWYRMFNWTGTGELLGWLDQWDEQGIYETLTTHMAVGNQIFTGAHMVRSAFGRPKIDCIVEVCTNLWNLCHDEIVDKNGVVGEGLGDYARSVASLEDTFKVLLRVPYVGPFMAYEMVTDMRHTRLLEKATDIMTWANPGPGAQRGLQRLGMPWKPDGAAVKSMELLLECGLMRGDFPQLEMRDIEHSLCEFDKYCRAKFGEGRPRSRYPGVA